MKRRKAYKSWEQAREDIENALHDKCNSNLNELCIESGLQLKNSVSHFPSPVFSVAYCRENKSLQEYYFVNYMASESGRNFVTKWKLDPQEGTSKIQKRFPIKNCLKTMIWIPNQHACIGSRRVLPGYCEDLTIRGYNGTTFEEKTRLTVQRSILCMIYLEDFDELVTGGQGFVMSWKVRFIEFGLPVEEMEPHLTCDVNFSREWVRRLVYDKSTKMLLVLTDQAVYIVSMVTRTQVEVIHNTHEASLTYCTFYRPYSYFITAARNGTIHVYHTAAKALIHKFSGHRDGLTGVVSLSKQPILISWSQSSGCLRMWRLDTLELSSETTLSESILDLQVVRNDRLLYRTDSYIRIFDINVLFSIFATLSSAAEYFRLCSVYRSMDGQDQVVGTQKLPSVNNKNKKKQLDRFEDKTEVKDKNEMNENSLKQLVGDGDLGDIDSCEKQDAVKDKQTDKKQHLASNKVLDTRLVCMLDDHCIMAVSPVSGIVLNIIYPLPDLDMPSVHVDLEENGNNCYVVLSDGQLMEYDCSVNPGQIGNIVKPGKRKQKIMSVVVMPVYLDVDSETTGQRLQAVLIGLDNGYIKLYDGGEKSNEPRTEGEGGRKIGVRRKTNINDVGPYLVMDDIKAHFGEVVLLCSPFEGSFRYKSETVHNTLISCGSDERIIIWRASTADTNNTIYLQIMMQKLKIIKLCEVSSCIGLTNNVILFGFINGVIELHKAEWKQMEAMKGAEITFAGSKTLLSHVKRISLDPELCHKDVVTSVSESHLLQLFATTSKDKFIKIWNTEGQLIREVLLGDVVTSVCFANGRDLLASLHNHIVRMEAHAYLPTEYLEKILSIADEFGISELEPEVPIPMEGSTDKMVCVIQGGEEEEESEPFDKWSTTPKKREVSSPVKTVRRNRQTLEMYLKLQQEEEQEEVFMETSLQKREAPVSRNVDKAALLISKLDLEKMEKYPIAPDGYIPNSVIRQKVFPPPPLPPPPFFKIPSSISSSTIGFEYSQEYVLDEFSDWDLTKYMHYDSSSGEERWSDIEDYGFSSNCGQWEAIRELRHFELKKYLKGRREEGNMKIVITPKRGKPRIKKLPVKTPSPEPEVVEEPEPEPVSIVDDTPPTPPPQPDKLSLLLNEVSRQMWCPRKITVDLLEYELPVLASVLEKSGRKITSEVCHYLSLIHDACTEYMEQSGENLFPEEIESEFAENLSKLLLSQYASCQIAAAEVITKFNIKFIKDAILSVLMPQFMKSDGSGISEDPEVISFASSVIAKLSPLISVEDLIHISKMMSIGDFLHTRINEEETTNIISSSLLQAGVEFTDVAVWASFILPLLPEKPPPPKPKRKPSVMPTLAKQNSFIKKNVEKVIAPPSPIIPSEPVQTDSIRDISTQKLSVIKMPQQEFDTLVFQPSTTSTDSSGSDRDSFLYYNPPRPSIEEKRSDVSLPNQIPETNFPSELALVNELRRMSNTEEFSLIRPVSLTNTLKKHSSTRFSLLDVTRSKEKNLRKESVQLLKVMKRVSTSKSMHDLHKVGPVKASRVITKESKTMISPSLSDVASVQSWKETIETAPTNDTKEGSKVSPVTNGSGGTDKSSESLVVSRGRDKLSSSDSSKSTVLIPPPFEQRIDSPIPEKKYKPPPIYAKISVKPAVRIKKEAEVVLPEISEASSNSSTIYPVYSLSGGDETKITTSLSSPDTSGVEIAQWRVILRNLRITRITKSQKRKAALTETNLTSLARPTLPTIQNWFDSFTVTNCRPKVTSPGRSLQRRVSDRLRKESRTMRTPAFAVARRRSAEGLTSKFEWATPFAPAHVRDSIR